jgi:hypothetical protein
MKYFGMKTFFMRVEEFNMKKESRERFDCRAR